MKKYISILFVFFSFVILGSCSTSYKAKPLSFKTPSSYNNVVNIESAKIAAKAFADSTEAKEAFGFDIIGAGMLPVQVVFDNYGDHILEINGQQTFLKDNNGNLWPVLSGKVAYERAAKYSQTKNIAKEGAYKGLLGAATGSIIGVAIGIVSGSNVAEAMGKGAAVGAAAGATIGGATGYQSDDARREITNDLYEKSLQNKIVNPKTLAHGILFFPGEAGSAKQLRLQLLEKDTGKIHVLNFIF